MSTLPPIAVKPGMRDGERSPGYSIDKQPDMEGEINQGALRAWDTYRSMVGGKAFNGDPLPDWDTLVADPKKEQIVKAWRAVSDRLASFWLDYSMRIKAESNG